VTQVVVLDDWQGVARAHGPWERLDDRCTVRFLHSHVTDADALVAELAMADVVVAMRERTPFPAAVLERLPALRLLVTTGMANASIDLESTAARGVTVSGTSMYAPPTAELTWGLILASIKHIPLEHHAVGKGHWQTTVGGDLAKGRLGVIGLGRLGSRVARVGLAFDMDVVAWSHNLTTERATEVGAALVPLDELLATSDVVTLHVRLSERTSGLLGARELALMKHGALLVNTSRGPLVEERALLAALDEGRIRAAVDVYDQEPLPPDHPLRSAPGLIHTPHVGYVTEATYGRFFTEIVEDIEAYLDGSPLRVLTP
jgi:phosphoglycerate dehydrogenase-like enzyme